MTSTLACPQAHCIHHTWHPMPEAAAELAAHLETIHDKHDMAVTSLVGMAVYLAQKKEET